MLGKNILTVSLKTFAGFLVRKTVRIFKIESQLGHLPSYVLSLQSRLDFFQNRA